MGKCRRWHGFGMYMGKSRRIVPLSRRKRCLCENVPFYEFRKNKYEWLEKITPRKSYSIKIEKSAKKWVKAAGLIWHAFGTRLARLL